MSKSTDIAQQIVDAAKRDNWALDVRGSILTITKGIAPNDKDAFVAADMSYYSVLDKLPITSPGSVWGTGGSGMGALTAMRTGRFVMNKSGGNKRVLNALKKMGY
jgi:hypothetical protein